MIKKLKKTKKHIIKKKLKNKSRKTIQKGGSSNIKESKPESLLIYYPGLIISNNQDITGQDKFYNKEPTVIITNANPNKLYMVTMTDPDAPNGEGNQDNFIFTHLVYIKSDKAKIIYVPYSPPTPPKGIHRYQFNLYDITNKSFDSSSPVKLSASDLLILRATKEEINEPNFRKTYNNKLSSFLKLKFKPIFTIQYKVTSKDMLEKIKNKSIPESTPESKPESAQESTQQSAQQNNISNKEKFKIQQEQIKQLQKKSNAPGLKTFLAVDLGINILGNLLR